jgi:hypothetical protein
MIFKIICYMSTEITSIVSITVYNNFTLILLSFSPRGSAWLFGGGAEYLWEDAKQCAPYLKIRPCFQNVV